jgi:hypothetical protein
MRNPTIKCIANSDTDTGPEVPFYDCPCPTCTRMEWELTMSDLGMTRITLKAHRANNFPENWTL